MKWILQFGVLLFYNINRLYATGFRMHTKENLLKLREEVREMFDHAYTGYMNHAYPYDELRPLTCDGVDTWGSYSLTLIDALDTLAVMGNFSEFRKIVEIVSSKANFDADINVSVFETNIRIVGGLLSAHLLSKKAGVELEPGWPCNGPLLRLAEDVARRLLPAFDTPTGMPYGTVNLRHGVPPGETTVTCTAGVGTFIVEFGTLSRLTGDPVYEEVALNALNSLFTQRSKIGLFGNHIDVATGRWVALDSGIGAGVDSFFEYLVKGSFLLERSEFMAMFKEVKGPIERYLKKNNWYVWASMHKGQVTLPVFQSLEAFWPGLLSLVGDVDSALRSMHNYNKVWKQYGFIPEFYNIPQNEAGSNRESYPLRPEFAESAMYLYRATKDPFMLDIGINMLRSLQYSAKTSCGYATIKDARDHTLENRMESFFLAETTKYLYLLFDPDNFIHNNGKSGKIHILPSGKQCILDAGGYIFNTEAHLIDPSALRCCYDWKVEKYDGNIESLNIKGDKLQSRQKDRFKTDQLLANNFASFPSSSEKSEEGNLNDDMSGGYETFSKSCENLESLLCIANKNREQNQNNQISDEDDEPVFSSGNASDLPIEWPLNSTMIYKEPGNGPEFHEDSQKLPNSNLIISENTPIDQEGALIEEDKYEESLSAPHFLDPVKSSDRDNEDTDSYRKRLDNKVLPGPRFSEPVRTNQIFNDEDEDEDEDDPAASGILKENEEDARVSNFLTEILGLIEPKEKLDSRILEPVIINRGSKYFITDTNHVMTCPAQPFHMRLTIAGEFIEER